MGNLRLRGKDLQRVGLVQDTARSVAIDIVGRHFKHHTRNQLISLIQQVVLRPADFLNDAHWAPLAELLCPEPTEKPVVENATLREQADAFAVFGRKHIEPQAIRQMEQAMQLPIAQAGALMPDAHMGYGLPIGGVLAAENAVIPYGVGMDIGCRMALTVFDAKSDFAKRYRHKLETALVDNTHFGIETTPKVQHWHEVLDNPLFREHEIARKHHGKASKQLGSSGSGNHFVELGELSIAEQNRLGLPQGEYLALLSHSGSRGLGAAIAQHFTHVAMQRLNLPKGYKHLAWLHLDSDAGAAYWALMNLAGDYAKACHDVIHQQMTKALGLKPLLKVENHHNFAWREQVNGRELIVHRKGATPAAEGVLGIIPGSMTANGYLVRGLGNPESLSSASHGAGRHMSRGEARNSITGSALKKVLKEAGVSLIGGQVDEAPMVYKNIEEVMLAQQHLVSIEGRFTPRVVRMDNK